MCFKKRVSYMAFISFKKVESGLVVFCVCESSFVSVYFMQDTIYINIDTSAFFLPTNVRDAKSSGG